MSSRFNTLAESRAFYQAQHAHPVCRRLHVAGVLLGAAAAMTAAATGRWSALWVAPAITQLSSWVGHRFFEKNRPATFHYPLYGFVGLMLMTWDTLRGRRAPR